MIDFLNNKERLSPDGGGSSSANPEAKDRKNRDKEFLADFFNLCQLYQSLRGWKKDDFAMLKTDLNREWRNKKNTDRRFQPNAELQTALAEIEQEYNQVFSRLEAVVESCFASSRLQEIFQAQLGQEIHSLAEAEEYIQKTAEPFYLDFKDKNPFGERINDFPTEHSSEEDLKEYQAVLQEITDNPNWQAIVKKLTVLPGPHHKALEQYQQEEDVETKNKALRRLLGLGRPEEVEQEDFPIDLNKLEIDFDEESLRRLKSDLSQAKTALEQFQTRWPKVWGEADLTNLGRKKDADRSQETETPFEYNEAEAKRLGLERLELAGYPEADVLIQEFTGKIRSILAKLITARDEYQKKELDEKLEAEKTAFESAWQKDCPDLPIPLRTDDDKWWYLTQLAKGRIISSLTDDSKTVSPHFSRQEVILADSWQEKNMDDKVLGTEDEELQTITSPLLQEFLGHDFKGVVNIEREVIDAALWEGDPGERVPSIKHKEILAKLGLDPNEFEFRCISHDEYARGSASKGWGQKNLWTNFDHYLLEDDGEHFGLDGGYREGGGAGAVGSYWRGSALEYLAVRLVLSRRPRTRA